MLFHDFETIHAALSVFWSGGAVYGGSTAPQTLALYAQQHGISLTGPIHYPPAALVLLGPMALFSNSIAPWAWFIFSVATLVWTARRCKAPLITAFIFMPTLICLLTGQLGIILLIPLLVADKTRSASALRAAGWLIALAFILKPPLILLLIVWGTVYTVVRKQFAFVRGLFETVAILSLGAELMQPGIHRIYLSQVADPTVWQTPTIATALRLSVRALGLSNKLLDTLLTWTPGPVALIFVAIDALRAASRTKTPQSSTANSAIFWTLIGIGCCVTPYLWWSDFVLLLPLFLMLATNSERRIRWSALSLQVMLALQACSAWVTWHVFWFPNAITALAYAARAKNEESTHVTEQ